VQYTYFVEMKTSSNLGNFFFPYSIDLLLRTISRLTTQKFDKCDLVHLQEHQTKRELYSKCYPIYVLLIVHLDSCM
jgi:hypothetical protein